MIRNSIITGDIHCANRKAFGIPTSAGINSRMENCLHVLEEIFTYAKTHSISKIFILGDIFHTRGSIETAVYNRVYEFFEKYSPFYKIFILVGNHDQATKNGEVHALFPFSAISKNILVISSPTLIENTYFVPYSDHLDSEKFEDATFLLGHFGVNGAAVSASNYIIGKTISPKSLKKYKKVFLNHFHKYQVLGNIYLPGSPLQHSFGEREEVKGFFHIQDNYDVSFIETHAPKFKLIEVSSSEEVINCSDTDYVHFVIKSKRVKNTDFSQYSKNYKVTIDLPRTFEERLKIQSEEEDLAILEKYLIRFKDSLEQQGLNIEKMKEIGKIILEKRNEQSF